MPGSGRPFPRGTSEAAYRAALHRAMTNPRTVLQFTELAAKLNREIGSHAEPMAGRTVIKLITNVDPEKMRRRPLAAHE